MKHLSVIFLFAIACQAPHRSTANLAELPPVELGEVWQSQHEQQTLTILDETREIVQSRAAQNGRLQRDAHPKAHGCPKAFFTVDNSQLPVGLRVGVFAQNQQRFAAYVRFSSGDPDGAKRSDSEKDVRGMAIKLMNVAGSDSGSQDFLMINSKEFFSKDGGDYVSLFKALRGGTPQLLLYGLTHPTSARRLLAARVQIASPITTSYFSSTPYKLGARSMRFKAEPCSPHTVALPERPAPNYLQQHLVETLAQKEVCYRFFLQPNMRPQDNPVEDPRQEWKENHSPYIPVATLTIPIQTQLDSPAQMNFCENLSMNPWHTLEATRPLGQINRMRKLIYHEISRLRHEGNRAPLLEPTNHSPCEGASAALCEPPP